MEILLAAIIIWLPLIIIFSVVQLLSKYVYQKIHETCYVVAYQCYKASDELKLDTGTSAKIILRNRNLGIEEYRFLLKTMVRSGIGEETYCSRNFLEGREMFPTLRDSIQEMEETVFCILDKLFATSAVFPSQVDILVTTGSLFAPLPSLSGRIINRYKMKECVKSFSMTGMGCSSSVVAIDLVRQLFKTQRDSFAVVVAMEITAANWYSGRDRSMLLSNVLFRAGGTAILLTNNPAWRSQAILKLKAVVRTHLSADEAYGCAIHEEDDKGYLGARLTKDLPKVVMEGLKENFGVMLPKVLPIWEIARFAVAKSYWEAKVMFAGNNTKGFKEPGINMKTGIQHFCIHTGGRAVIDGFKESFGLGEYDVEASRMALHRFGNTSCSSLWYVLGYMDAKKRLKKGDAILMVGLGAGFLCNTCVWTVLRDLEDSNVWGDCIDRYPVDTLGNPFAEKLDWVYDDDMSFVRIEDIDRTQLLT